MKVYVYRNLNKGGFSVMHRQKVIKVVDSITLIGVELRVREGGQNRARDEMQRNVHAFCVGTESDLQFIGDLQEVTYNPFIHNSFVIKETQEPILFCDVAVLRENKLYIPKK
jgi:hypothetical protein